MSTCTPRLQITITDAEELQADLTETVARHGLAAAAEHLTEHYDAVTYSYARRHMPTLLTLDPWHLARLLDHADPTGERAVRNVLREEVYA